MSYIFIGFDKKIDPLIRTAKEFTEMFTEVMYSENQRLKVIEYLEKGVYLSGVTFFMYDNERLPVGNLDYYTDGKFIWPIYYVYYLKKYNDFYIDTTLYEHIYSNHFKLEKIDKAEMKKIEKVFDAEWSGNYDVSILD